MIEDLFGKDICFTIERFIQMANGKQDLSRYLKEFRNLKA